MSVEEARPLQRRMPVRVLAAVIRRGTRVLLCRRPDGKRHGGMWEFPGGKLEAGESLAEAAVRELREELDVAATSLGEALYTCSDPGSVYVIEFVDVRIAGEPVALEHAAIRWVEPAAALELPLAPADRAFVLHLTRASRADDDTEARPAP